ncbi:glyoxylase-like metal-dependent hydrolase (beta-lactamase superfamily II) [Deinobacterium chartae]|uniref:Glyoxylase-like metal-dependent hydrolase (Beta-lactamase superfamily II) n=1 Tax=Deinobacterium chartae TaxID=521158 RepID=A0A841HXL6_9DEIO|nr:MBL fold metallo-hydrolase [Deinobacterium chartae]MBB6098147.1 glyoxylase-like metal-dependent hydrolase (beta-lactamase superfamily II) [Deinobacterium chartae]
MIQLAPDVFLIPLAPRFAINAYLLGDVLIDAGTRYSAARLLRALRGRSVSAHALTHAHPDHQGASHAVCTRLGIPLWTSALEAAAAVSGDLRSQLPNSFPARLEQRYWAGPGHPVTRLLRAGDRVHDFEVLEVPGHSPGHLAFWRARDRVLIAGDVLSNLDLRTLRSGLREPPAIFTPDAPANRASLRRLAALRPEVVAFGHGAPLRDPEALARFAARLPGAPWSGSGGAL